MPSDIQIHSLTDEFDMSSFKCEKARFEEYLRKDSFVDHNSRVGRVFLFVHKRNRQILGFVTIAMNHLPREKHFILEKMTSYGNVPELLLGQLARHYDYQKMGVGRFMLDWVMDHAIKLSFKVGCRLIIVQSDEDKVDWYVKNGFTLVKGSKNKLFLDIL